MVDALNDKAPYGWISKGIKFVVPLEVDLRTIRHIRSRNVQAPLQTTFAASSSAATASY